jgi:hypothetical protein
MRAVAKRAQQLQLEFRLVARPQGLERAGCSAQAMRVQATAQACPRAQ